jgi:hypothetical protein
MGVLGQMISRDVVGRLPENSSTAKKPVEEKNGSVIPLPPNAACEKCSSLQFWLDGYGNWNCGGCNSPKVLAFIREIHTVDPNAETVEVDGQTWIRRECNCRPGWELAGIPEKNRWWVKCDFEKTLQDPQVKKGGLAIISTTKS